MQSTRRRTNSPVDQATAAARLHLDPSRKAVSPDGDAGRTPSLCGRRAVGYSRIAARRADWRPLADVQPVRRRPGVYRSFPTPTWRRPRPRTVPGAPPRAAPEAHDRTARRRRQVPDRRQAAPDPGESAGASAEPLPPSGRRVRRPRTLQRVRTGSGRAEPPNVRTFRSQPSRGRVHPLGAGEGGGPPVRQPGPESQAPQRPGAQPV